MSDPDLTPSEQQVRRLLAGARHDEPMPDDVVDRLDRVLADLRPDDRRTPPPVELGARRRRHLGRRLLVAAAAAVVLGVGISQLDLSGQGSDSTSGADSSTADSGGEAAGSGDALSGVDRPLAVNSESFDTEVRQLYAAGALTPSPSALKDADGAFAENRAWCDAPEWGPGRRVAVRYDGQRSVLVLRAASGGSRTVDLYRCGESVALRSTTVPVE